MKLTFRKTLAIVSRDRSLTVADKAHLRRWADVVYANDSSWERLSTAARARGLLPVNGIYESITREALFIRGHAESVRSGMDFELRERQQQHERHLALAQKAEDLADYYKWAQQHSGIAMFFRRFLNPVANLEALHRKEAELLRRRIGRPPTAAARVSRQDGRRNRKGMRKVIAFIDLASSFIKDWISEKPDHIAIAVLTEIAFPGYYIGAEDVRKALEPTKRADRKASRALAPKKSKRVRES